jgi:hypothetical protein
MQIGKKRRTVSIAEVPFMETGFVTAVLIAVKIPTARIAMKHGIVRDVRIA